MIDTDWYYIYLNYIRQGAPETQLYTLQGHVWRGCKNPVSLIKSTKKDWFCRLTIQDGRREVALILASAWCGWWSVWVGVLPLLEERFCLIEDGLYAVYQQLSRHGWRYEIWLGLIIV